MKLDNISIAGKLTGKYAWFEDHTIVLILGKVNRGNSRPLLHLEESYYVLTVLDKERSIFDENELTVIEDPTIIKLLYE